MDDEMTLDQDFLPARCSPWCQSQREHAVTQEVVFRSTTTAAAGNG